MQRTLKLLFVVAVASTVGLFAFASPGFAEENGTTQQSTESEATVTASSNITKQPVDVSVSMPEYFTFSVEAKDTASTYQWQYLVPDETADWEDIADASGKAATLKGVSGDGYDGWSFRCIVTASDTTTETSNAATLSVGFTHTYVVVEGNPLLPGQTYACSKGGSVALSANGNTLTLDNAQIDYSPSFFFDLNEALTVISYGADEFTVKVKGTNTITCPEGLTETSVATGFLIMPQSNETPLSLAPEGSSATLNVTGKVNGLYINKAAGNLFESKIKTGLTINSKSLLTKNGLGEIVMSPMGFGCVVKSLTVDGGSTINATSLAGAAAYLFGDVVLEKGSALHCLNDSHDTDDNSSNNLGVEIPKSLTMTGATLTAELTDNRAWQGSAGIIINDATIQAASDGTRSTVTSTVNGTDARFAAGLICTGTMVVDKSDITCTIDNANEDPNKIGSYVRGIDSGSDCTIKNGSIVKATARGNGTVFGVNGRSINNETAEYEGVITVDNATLIGTANGFDDSIALFGILGFKLTTNMTEDGWEVTGSAPHGIGLSAWLDDSKTPIHYQSGYTPSKIELKGKSHIRIPLNYSDISTASAYQNQGSYYQLEAVYGQNHLTPAPTASIVSYEWAGTWQQLQGKDRYETMDAVVRSGWKQSDTAILVTGQNFPDALSAAGLAATYDQAPIITTEPDYLSDQAKKLLTDLKVKNVVILGSTASVSQSAEDTVKAMNIQTKRLAGDSRYSTNLAIYQSTNKWSDTIIIAKGENYPDALSASPLASVTQSPILLTENMQLSDELKNALKDRATVKNVIIIGADAVDADTGEWLSGLTEGNNGAEPIAIFGADRYETNYRIATFMEGANGVNISKVAIATGEKFPDALVAGPLCGKNKAPILLMNDTPEGTITINEIIYPSRESITLGSFLGSDATISPELQAKVIAASKA